ncbi:Dolichyl-phosphate beta-glucosyltransferase [Golovinomyces cichoracearum]|uniref:dolichyl-phosphate beta-glucosyltransferase n=1 Tax=Golovinomyces cichoracearum TaxID=62708 RepID=A0A420J7Q1_9PEZI|nr:Dolichyl-phosphate beta-glucosyltransferase [Golovinomyces cichoracearum]
MVQAAFVVAVLLVTVLSFLNLIPYFLSFLIPKPRAPKPQEKTYVTSQPSGRRSSFRSLPCWYDTWLKQRKAAEDNHGHPYRHTGTIEEPELEISVVIPAYNEEKRIEAMLEEAIHFLDTEYGRVPEFKEKSTAHERCKEPSLKGMGGYEILIVNDGSKDKTVDVALAFSHKHELHDLLRVCTLSKNRGKGGAVTHGLRHVRGAYALFADADGASRFSDLRKLVEGCKEVADVSGRAISVGNRTHLIGSDAVVKRSALRNILMHSFHLLLRFLTPPATSRIQDTQCGFKLLTRSALPYIIPYMHTEGWIFDVEILMLAEGAPPAIMEGTAETESGIRVKEVFISWKEVSGSKLNVIWDCIGMAYGLALLRASWIFGLYKRR